MPIDLNPIPHSAYLRAVTLELEHELGVPAAREVPSLPPTTLFTLDPASSRTPNFNPLPGVRLAVPLTYEDAQPMARCVFRMANLRWAAPFPFRFRPS